MALTTMVGFGLQHGEVRGERHLGYVFGLDEDADYAIFLVVRRRDLRNKIVEETIRRGVAIRPVVLRNIWLPEIEKLLDLSDVQ